MAGLDIATINALLNMVTVAGMAYILRELRALVKDARDRHVNGPHG